VPCTVVSEMIHPNFKTQYHSPLIENCISIGRDKYVNAKVLNRTMIKHRAFMSKVRELVNSLNSKNKGLILMSVSVGWFLSIGLRYTFPSILPFIRNDLGINLFFGGVLLSAIWFGYAAGQIPGGILGDKYGEGNILTISTLISTICILFIFISFNPWMLFIFASLFGIATGLYAPHRFTIFTDIYPKNSGTAIGITMSAGSVGNTILPAGAALLAGYFTWRLGFGILVLPFIAITIIIYRHIPTRTSNIQSSDSLFDKNKLSKILTCVSDSAIPQVVFVHIVMSFVSYGFLGFYPTYLIEVKGLSSSIAAVIFSLYFAFGIIIQPLAGYIRDSFGSKHSLIGITGLVTIGLFLLQYFESIVAIIFITFLISYRNGLGVVTNTYIANNLDDEIKGSGLGIIRTSWTFVGALSPLFIGFVSDISSLSVSFLIISGVSIIGLLLCFFVDD